MNIVRDNVAMFKGETYTLEVTTNPKGLAVTYSVQPEGVVTVDSDAKVTAVNIGSAVVTASVGDSSDTVNISVTEEEI